MNNISCNIIRDILPLYADDVVSEDTKELVETHLDGCPDCQKMLDTMRTPMVIPPIPDEAKTMRNFKKRWSLKKVAQGILATLLVIALCVGCFMFVYGYGFPTKAADVELRTGFQCMSEDRSDEVTCPTGKQMWIVDTYALSGDIRDTAEFEYTNINGERVNTGVTLYMRRTPIVMPWDYAGPIRAGYSWPENLPTDAGYDFTVTFVFSDETVTYSLREEGILEEPKDHSPEFCTILWEESIQNGT